jgi:hypothetical protein
VALVALIAAYHESGEAGHLRATLPLAGRTVVERQARLAASAGANPVIIVVERLPAALSAAIERLRRDRVPVKLVRSAEEAAEAVDPYDRVLLIGDGAIVPAAQQVRLAAEPGPAVLTVPEGAHGELYERIDAEWRWAGLAAIDGGLLRQTARMLRDWDLQSTLLRRTLQAGAAHVEADNAAAVAILDREQDLDELERRIIAGADTANRSWSDVLLAPIERLVTMMLVGSPLSPQLIGLGAALLTGLAAAAFYVGWYWIGLIKLLAATPLEGIATRLARLRMQSGIRQSWWVYLIPFFAGVAFVILGYRLMPLYGWGIVLLPFVTFAFLAALSVETGERRVPGAVLLAERRGMTWLVLPFALFGQWPAGFILLAGYAAASFFWAQQQAHARPEPQGPPQGQD